MTMVVEVEASSTVTIVIGGGSSTETMVDERGASSTMTMLVKGGKPFPLKQCH